MPYKIISQIRDIKYLRFIDGWQSLSKDINSWDAGGKTLLIFTVLTGDLTMVRELVENRKADVNKTDNWNWTPLMWAAKNGDREIVEYLLNKAALPAINAKNQYGLTATLAAAFNGDADVLQLLIAKGADLALPDNLGTTAISYAAKNGHKLAVALLLNSNADPFIRDRFQKNAVDHARENGHEEIVRLIVNFPRLVQP
ncbi:MAG: ankyrin repeat domain-containing protein [Candidatus Margulisiibacteriota bacterium]|jgi:ankyrin repeat protein